MGEFVKVAKVSEIHSGQGKLIKTAASEVVIFNADGAFYAIANRCLFCGGSLSEATLQGTEIACPWDQAKFYLPTGKVVFPAIDQHLGTYRVRIERDEITLHLGDVNEWDLIGVQDPGIPIAWKWASYNVIAEE